MTEITNSLLLATDMVTAGDSRLAAIVALSLAVSFSATLISCLLGMPLGALLASGAFPAGACWWWCSMA